MGRQEIHLGAPIEPRELAALNYKERKQKVIGAINSLGQDAAVEVPAPGDPEFAEAAEAWARATGASHEHAVLFETLRRLQAPCAGTKELLEAAETGQLARPDDDKGRWMAEFARRLLGERGPASKA